MHDHLRRSLGNIVDDLWGTPAPAAPAAPIEPEKPVQKAQPAFPPFEQLWKAVDETVDWTEVLAHANPTDGLTPPETWALYRQHAAQVLSGDPESYLAVLKAVDPLKDLTPWAEKFDVVCRDADSLHVTFAAIPGLWESNGEQYLAGMLLRISRDLFALLPILQVEAEAVVSGETHLAVTFHRSELAKVRFAYIDPVSFVHQCGDKGVEG